ncbi:endonuclease domain-containing protein [Cupriavidus basilensis]|uniref:DUF559 domain-containing protein n=1 Tax=Cupriavidus basilensis TaxID=68895 RepID=A0A7M2HB03_9BURK|nr:DUF559 domain-containing protein [Cupriavidus basilensis]QOT82144.1 DUF559 domain-containing protein [Cupriavidus basilensis]
MKNNTIVVRAVLIPVLLLGGIAFPFLLLLAAFVAWTLWQDLTGPKASEPDPNAWYVLRHTAGPDDPNWKSYFTPVCESPAETAFLEAMITAFALVPDKGVLKGPGVTLDLQVKIPPYRADFVANGKLVIEVDGAAYHSSQEAIERDGDRDAVLVAKGYQVVRIPARVVFASPQQAIRSVQAGLNSLRKAQASQEIADQQAPRTSLKSMFSSAGKAISDVTDYVERASAVQAATEHARAQFESEKTVIGIAVQTAQRRLKVEAFCAQSEEHRKQFQESYDRIEMRLEHKEMPTIHIEPIAAPALHADPVINEAIQSAYQHLIQDRTEYFAKIRDSLRGEDAMRPLVQESLAKYGCASCWVHIC